MASEWRGSKQDRTHRANYKQKRRGNPNIGTGKLLGAAIWIEGKRGVKRVNKGGDYKVRLTAKRRIRQSQENQSG